MKVWLVFDEHIEFNDFVAAFDSEEKAEAFDDHDFDPGWSLGGGVGAGGKFVVEVDVQ